MSFLAFIEGIMPVPFKHQIEGALFLASRKSALLADEPRVGKTGSAILACDLVFARKVLIVTKASARANWAREVAEWGFPRKIQTIYSAPGWKLLPDTDVVVVAWSMVFSPSVLAQLCTVRWDASILDESHEAKNPAAKRTRAVYDELLPQSERVWCLTGTPFDTPNDLYPMLRALAPERIANTDGYEAFIRRYCTTKPRWLAGRKIDVITGGKNLDELHDRLKGFWLRRTQQDVGISKPIYSMFTVHPGTAHSEDLGDADAILAAAEAGDTASLDMHMGPLRRITGVLKARALVEAISEELDGGLDKIVLFSWHQNVLDVLNSGLSKYGVVGIDGRTPATARQAQVDEFQRGKARVFNGQITAAGEAIDLSAAANLMFVEGSFKPKDLSQAAMRASNLSQKRQVLVRFCALEGSIDEALMRIVKRKVAGIRELMKD